jgi:trehalose synthase
LDKVGGNEFGPSLEIDHYVEQTLADNRKQASGGSSGNEGRFESPYPKVWGTQSRMREVTTQAKQLTDYQGIVDSDCLAELHELAASLSGLKVLHVNATPVGGGVAEILRSLVPLLLDQGVKAEWYVMEGHENFFQVTKRLHNQLQGEPGELTTAERRAYESTNAANSAAMSSLSTDLWVIHDPQPLAAGARLNGNSPKIWRSHIDTSAPNKSAWNFLAPYVDAYDSLVFSDQSYLPRTEAGRVPAYFIPPAIDPLVWKNSHIDQARAKQRLSRLGIDPKRPLVSQVARLDKWKDPIGVIRAYRLAPQQLPSLQLALLGVIEAQDDPEALAMYDAVMEEVGGDPEIHVYVNPVDIEPEDIAAMQSASDVVVQKSLREGFGLAATEAMWQGTPVVAGNVGGLKLQVRNGETGYLVDTIAECADRIIELLSDRAKARRIGRAGQDSVRQRFLMPRLLLDELRLYSNAIQPRVAAEIEVAKTRDSEWRVRQ